MVRMAIYFTVFVVLVDAALSAKPRADRRSTSDSDSDSSSSATAISSSSSSVIKRKKKRSSERSTSSSSGADDTDGSSGSLAISGSSTSGSSESHKKDWPKSSDERKGWRKWHRKCNKCPVDARKKWRDPTIQWICGAYQRARRSFKSKCMMEYRNCQDGTMFVKIHNYRCANESSKEDYPHGEHFFYEYKVMLSDDSTTSGSTSTEESRTESSTEY